MKRMLAAMIVLALCATAHAELTLAKYNRIKNGMSFSSVKAILGSPQKQNMSFEYPGNKEEVYQWEESGHRTVIIGLLNDKVISHMQLGLE